MEDKNKVTIGIETRGFEEASEDIELLADAIAELPAVVNVKAKDCEIGIHTTNHIEIAKPEPSWAKGGVILKPDIGREWTPEEDEKVLPIGTINEMFMMEFLKETKKMCESTRCQDCFLADKNGDCKVVSVVPKDWRI